jgi:Holliday junction resolvasome RuvABC endonuclease subunit
MEESHSRELKLLFIRERIAEACSRLGRIQDFLQTVLTNDDTHEAAIEQLSEGYGEMWES